MGAPPQSDSYLHLFGCFSLSFKNLSLPDLLKSGLALGLLLFMASPLEPQRWRLWDHVSST